MYYPLNIKIKNLFSHEDTEYSFKHGQLSVFLGKNEHDIGANSNGAGKSTIVEAITLVATGNVYRDVTKEEFIRDGQKECIVELNLHNDVLNHSLTIKRTVFNNTKPQSLYIKFSNKPKSEVFASINEGNAEIFNILGITKEDFLNYFVIGQDNSDSFFKSKDTKQKEIIGRFSNYTAIDNIIQEKQKHVSLLLNQQASIDVEIQRIESKVELLQSQLEDINNENEITNQDVTQKVLQIENNIAETLEDINLLQIENKKLTKKSQETTLLINCMDSVQKDYDKIIEEINELDNNIHNNNKNIKRFELLLTSKIECPKCSESFILNNDQEVETIEHDLSEARITKEQYKTQKIVKQNKLDKVELELQSLEELRLLVKSNTRKIKTNNENIEIHQENIKTYEKSIQKLKQSKVVNKQDEISSLILQIKSENDKIEEKQICYQDFTDKIQQQNKFLFHLGKSGFKTYLANKSIKHIQDMTNYYLDKFNVNLNVDISGFKVLKSGEVRDKITVRIVKNDNKSIKTSSFGGFSGGEKCRVDICGILSLKNIINNAAPYGKGLDLLILDEFLQGLDVKGSEKVLQILDGSKQTTICVMHHIENLSIKNKVLCVKVDGKTTIQQ